jgi:hypothetical protein
MVSQHLSGETEENPLKTAISISRVPVETGTEYRWNMILENYLYADPLS